jgi:hypothetical protein
MKESREVSEVKIPARSFAIAADTAAKLFGVDPAIVFIERTHPARRARLVAMCAMFRIFHKVKRTAIAQGFGFEMEYCQIADAIAKSKRLPWWDDSYIDKTADAVRHDLFRNPEPPHIDVDHAGDLVFSAEDEPIDRTHEIERKAERYVPRKFKPARIINPALSRRGNVTSALLGDAPPGRREMLSAMPSLSYRAGIEGRTFSPRSKEYLEAAE